MNHTVISLEQGLVRQEHPKVNQTGDQVFFSSIFSK